MFDGVRYSVPGDYATVDADGTVRLLGRGSASINTGGEKVYPEEVEAELRKHPSVFDCVVVGVPDDRFGEKVVALVQVTDNHYLDEAELTAWCRAKLAGYKTPRRFLVRRLAATVPPRARRTTRSSATLAIELLRRRRPPAELRRRGRAAPTTRERRGCGELQPACPNAVDAVAPVALGVVERGVGRGHEPFAVERVVGHRRDAGADRHRHACTDLRAISRPHAVGDPHRVVAGRSPGSSTTNSSPP